MSFSLETTKEGALLKNRREITLLLPVKALVYEDDDGQTQCGRLDIPHLDEVAEFVDQGLEHPQVKALLKYKEPTSE